ncbi:MAG: glycosyltransferase, partial [Planctomycetota bacterium]
DKPGFVMPHGVFDGVYPNTATTAEARRRLGIPAGATVAAAIGGIHRYKNLAALVREHTRLGRKDLWLVIAGKPADADLAAELVDAAAGRSDVVLQLRFIPDDRLQDYFMAADFCVAPYEDILNSGAVMLAISFGRPVVCPAIGSLVELQQAVGDGWVRTYDGPFNAGVLADAAEWSRSPRPPKPEIAAMQWDSIAQQTLAAYRELIGIGSKPPRFTL